MAGNNMRENGCYLWLWSNSDSVCLSDCPLGWELHEHSCYHVIDTPTANQSDARRTCQNLGGDLAIIRSADENNFISDLVIKHQKVQDYYGAWIGLYRKPDNAFYWIDDTPLTGQYSAWADGQPSQPSEKCVHTYTDLSKLGKWNDNQCNLLQSKWIAPIVLCQTGKYIWGAFFFFWTIFFSVQSQFSWYLSRVGLAHCLKYWQIFDNETEHELNILIFRLSRVFTSDASTRALISP